MLNERKCGILLHPTSFPSPYGIGDLGSQAYKFVDFLKAGGQRLWQTLPMGPTSFGDSPYQSFSAFAGNFYLLSPDLLLEENLLNKNDLSDIPSFSADKVEYGAVIQYKTMLFKKAFANFDVKSNAFKTFCHQNTYWLEDYALFSSLKDYFIEKRKFEYESEDFVSFKIETKTLLDEDSQKDFYYGGVWSTWPKALVNREPKAIKEAKCLLSTEMDYYKFLQFKFFDQWTNVKAYAKKNDVEIIGDIPIFVAYDSADTWGNQPLFHLDNKGFPIDVAGVPPDYFCTTGQLWGNPLYNWKAHEKSNYKWWINRVKSLLLTCDVIRIDHFIGFESNYAIPFGSKDASEGKWIQGPGKNLFVEIEKEIGVLPIIAEDLGIITPKVTKLRQSCNLPGMRVLQFAFDDSQNNSYLPHNYEKDTVVYTGTHDNDTTLSWYNKSDQKTSDLFRRYMNTDASAPSWDLIRLAISSVANTAIYPLQDVLTLDGNGRMNIPGQKGGNWQWRYREEQLLPSYAESLFYLTKLFKR